VLGNQRPITSAGISRHLSRHGIRAETIRTVLASSPTLGLLLNYALPT
jgi:hypothetical protein